MKTLTFGDRSYRVGAERREGRWIGYAERADIGDRYGVECAGESESEAADKVARWLEWQSEHAAALEALQQAERALHRTIAGSAFATVVEGPSAIEMQRESLDQVEAARVRLDEIRARRPER